MANRVFIIALLIGFSLKSSSGQAPPNTLTYENFIANIIQFHPLAKQANLKRGLASAELLSAKGNLDPVISSNWNQKNFDDKLYYRQFQGKLQIPTKLGIDIVGGYENTDGLYLNPENKTDNYGLWNIGVEANLMQGLWVNERNIKLRQAKVYQEIAENQRQIILNDLLYQGSLAYLYWQQYDATAQIIKESTDIAETYFKNTKEAYLNGEKTAIDTLEAFMIIQDRELLLQANNALLTKARQNIKNYLWLDGLPQKELDDTQPEEIGNTIFSNPKTTSPELLLNGSPLLLEKQNKQTYYEIEQRLKKEKLKPKLKGKFMPLLGTSDTGLAPNYSTANYKWGFDFKFPILLRTERAAIEKGEIKLEGIKLDIQNKQNELKNKIDNSLEQQQILIAQRTLQEDNLDGYRRLLEAENQKFQFGESSVFLLNKRQEKYINGQLKYIKINVKLKAEQLYFLLLTNQPYVD